VGPGAGEDAGHDSGPGPDTGLDVAGRVADDGQFADRAGPEAEQRGQGQVGPRAAAARVGGREGQVDERPPVQRVDQGVAGGPGESREQADLDARGAHRGHDLGRPRQRGHLAGPHRRGVVLLERLVGVQRRGLVAQDPAEHLDLGLAHARADVVHGLGVAVLGQAAPGDGGTERVQHDAVVPHGGARHVQARDADGAHWNVSSAIAGEQVMPRPPGPVTRTTPGAIWDR
jgi:hypothetical protein